MGRMARTLYLTLRSPFARKVQIVLAEKGLAYEPVVVDLADKPPAFVALGPIARVPVLVDGDVTVFDSTVIVEYLEDRYPTPALYGAGWQARLLARRWEELGDTIGDAAIPIFMNREPVGVERAQALLDRVLAHADAHLDELPEAFGIAQASLVAGLGYMQFRLGDGWRARAPRLAAWADAQAARPSVADTAPRG